MTHFKWSRFIHSRFGREISAKQMKNKDNQKQRRWNETECFWLQFSGVIMKFKGFTTISPSHSLFSSYTSAWHEMKASMKRANRRRWVDVVVWSQSVCFGLLCARVCVCVRACMHVWVRAYVCVLWNKLGSDSRVLCPTPPTSILLLNQSPRWIPRRPWKVGLHLNKFSSNWPRSVTFLNPVCLADG